MGPMGDLDRTIKQNINLKVINKFKVQILKIFNGRWDYQIKDESLFLLTHQLWNLIPACTNPKNHQFFVGYAWPKENTTRRQDLKGQIFYI
jgi:hypothetical protein